LAAPSQLNAPQHLGCTAPPGRRLCGQPSGPAALGPKPPTRTRHTPRNTAKAARGLVAGHVHLSVPCRRHTWMGGLGRAFSAQIRRVGILASLDNNRAKCTACGWKIVVAGMRAVRRCGLSALQGKTTLRLKRPRISVWPLCCSKGTHRATIRSAITGGNSGEITELPGQRNLITSLSVNTPQNQAHRPSYRQFRVCDVGWSQPNDWSVMIRLPSPYISCPSASPIRTETARARLHSTSPIMGQQAELTPSNTRQNRRTRGQNRSVPAKAVTGDKAENNYPADAGPPRRSPRAWTDPTSWQGRSRFQNCRGQSRRANAAIATHRHGRAPQNRACPAPPRRRVLVQLFAKPFAFGIRKRLGHCRCACK